MSVKVMGQVWELNLPPGPKMVLLALADHADHDGTHCYPGVGRIAWMTGLDDRTVRRHLSMLRKAELIVPHAFATGGRGRATDYDLHPEKGDRLSSFVGEGAGESLTETTGFAGETLTKNAVNPDTMPPQPSGTVRETPKKESLGCEREGCDRPREHAGPHRDPWYEAIGQAVYPGEEIPDHHRALAGKLAMRARKAKHEPARILQAAAWIVEQWGPSKLTMGSLVEHYERASGQLAQNTEQVKRRLSGMAKPKAKAPAHEHDWQQHFKNPQWEVCLTCGDRREKGTP